MYFNKHRHKTFHIYFCILDEFDLCIEQWFLCFFWSYEAILNINKYQTRSTFHIKNNFVFIHFSKTRIPN